ncbi:hypothetical protein EVAR_11713_1 [Eumeta japonica]|uniref:Uncharacterized protein n=1 Tax=Eumeta variegata TaxID=151549 RepID=A0A4C1U5C3_EUMVA|nr:hypothetical protein EVAR_11713_1 [Eumeta japonica]
MSFYFKYETPNSVPSEAKQAIGLGREQTPTRTQSAYLAIDPSIAVSPDSNFAFDSYYTVPLGYISGSTSGSYDLGLTLNCDPNFTLGFNSNSACRYECGLRIDELSVSFTPTTKESLRRWRASCKRWINALQMQFLRSICGVSLKDRCTNSDIRERCGLKEDVATREERDMLRCFRHIEMMNENRLKKQIYKVNVYDGRVGKGRAKKSYADHIGAILIKGQILSTRNRRA